MRITPVISNLFLAKKEFKNNHSDYSQYRYPVLPALDKDTVSFSANVPKIYASNSRNAVTSLAGYGVTCVCCGKKMIDPSDVARMDAEGLFKGPSKNILEVLKQFEGYMKPLEKRVFNLLLKLQEQYPDKNLAKLLETKKHDLETKLIDKQSRVFDKIHDYCHKRFSEEKMEELNTIIQDSYDEMYGRKPKVTFSRKKFIGLIYKFTRNIEPKHQKKLLDLAEKLPSSQDMFEAFIIKYSRKNNREIAHRLIERSIATIEHIKPRAEGGPDSIYNYAAECEEDNWARGCRPMLEQIQKHPDMPQNAQKHINQIISLVNNGDSGVDAKYVQELKEALYRASGGVIDLDISKLKTDLPPKDIY